MSSEQGYNPRVEEARLLLRQFEERKDPRLLALADYALGLANVGGADVTGLREIVEGHFQALKI